MGQRSRGCERRSGREELLAKINKPAKERRLLPFDFPERKDAVKQRLVVSRKRVPEQQAIESGPPGVLLDLRQPEGGAVPAVHSPADASLSRPIPEEVEF